MSQETTSSARDSNTGFGRGRAALSTFLGGFTGAAIFGAFRKMMQVRMEQEKQLDGGKPLPHASEAQVRESRVLRYRDAAEKLIPGFDRKTANEYGEFATFFSFMTGTAVLKPLYEKLLGKREPEQGENAAPKRGPIAAAKGGLSWLTHYVIRFPLGAAAALVPYALMGKFLDNHLYTGTKEIPADANLVEHAATSLHNAVQTPFAKMLSRVAIMFSTFNISHRALSRTLDKTIGPAPGKEREPAPPRNIFANAFKELYDATFGTVLPVMISVVPLVSTLFFTNETQKKNFEERLTKKALAEHLFLKKKGPVEISAVDALMDTGFKLGTLLNRTAKNIYHSVTTENLRAKFSEKGLNIGEQEAMAAFALASGIAYGSFAALRTDAVEPTVKKTFAVGKAFAPRPAEQTADAQIAAVQDASAAAIRQHP